MADSERAQVALIAVAGFGLFFGSVPGCSDPRYLLTQYAQNAASAPTPNTRFQITAAMLADWQAGTITLDLALDHAHRLLEDGQDATVYAGAVLDLAAQIEPHLPRDPAMSLLLNRRIGRLAFQAAAVAYRNGRLAEAESLVLAGPGRWQDEAYWLTYPDHDALVALIWASNGQRIEAIHRLSGRSILTGPADEAYKMLGGRE